MRKILPEIEEILSEKGLFSRWLMVEKDTGQNAQASI